MDFPSDQLAGMNLNQDDDGGLLQYVSSNDDAISMVGSSASQTKQTFLELEAEMIKNTVETVKKLRQQVLAYYLFSVSTLTIVFYRLQSCSRRLLLDLLLFQLLWKWC